MRERTPVTVRVQTTKTVTEEKEVSLALPLFIFREDPDCGEHWEVYNTFRAVGQERVVTLTFMANWNCDDIEVSIEAEKTTDNVLGRVYQHMEGWEEVGVEVWERAVKLVGDIAAGEVKRLRDGVMESVLGKA